MIPFFGNVGGEREPRKNDLTFLPCAGWINEYGLFFIGTCIRINALFLEMDTAMSSIAKLQWVRPSRCPEERRTGFPFSTRVTAAPHHPVETSTVIPCLSRGSCSDEHAVEMSFYSPFQHCFQHYSTPLL